MAAIRPMVPADLPILKAIEDAAQRQPWSLAQLRSELEHGTGFVYGEGAPEAFIFLRFACDEMEIVNIAVRPDCQKRGIGGRLIERALAAARKSNIKKVFLEVRPSNRAALGLYRKHGFGATGRRKAYYPDKEDAVAMALEFRNM
jgi:ribosomal-protein-alanine N-acetyltransferase